MTTRFLAKASAFLALAGSLFAAASQPSLPDNLDLQTAIRFAVDNNYTIRQARERIRQQEGVVIQVNAQRIPKLTATGSYSGNDKEISKYTPTDDRDWTISLQASQTLYAGGSVSASIRSAKLTREAALLELQSVINEQLLLVRTRFYTVLLNRQRVSVQEENVKLLAEQLKTARSRFEAGASSNFEVLRAEVALANGNPPLIQARNDYRISIEELRQALGLGDGGTKLPEVVGSLDVGPREDLQINDVLGSARANRPELQRVTKLVNAGEEGVKVARAGYLPTVSLVGGYSWNRGVPTASWDNRRDGWSAGLEGQWNIFDGRATAGKVVQAKSQLAQAKLTVDDLTLSIDVEVRRAHSSLQEAWELVESTNKVVSQAEEALRLANVRYSAGTATQLDVLTSQVALTEARLNQLTSNYNYNVAVATLRKAMGKADSFVTN